MRRQPAAILKSLTQRTLFAFEQFSLNEMANHAAAGAYGFLLSAVPAFLVILYLSSLVMGSFDVDASTIVSFIGPYLDDFGGTAALNAFLSKPLTTFTGAFGVINLIWAARLFIVSIQRGIRVVYADTGRAGPVRENVFTFAIELILLFAVIVIIAMNQVMRAVMSYIEWAPLLSFLGRGISMGITLLPIAALWAFIFLTYKNVPPVKPGTKHAALSATLCVLAYLGLGYVLGLFMNAERYGILYGILGNLIVALIKVYFFFWLYFFFAEFTHTLENFDALLFSRFHKVTKAAKQANRLERMLFAEPQRLFGRYARSYEAGQLVFSRGDTDRSALYLYRGAIDIYITPPDGASAKPMSRIGEGDFFGEMAWILEEPRSAWAVAASDSVVFVLPPKLFERFLAQDAGASSRLVELLASRLKDNNDYLAGGKPR